MTPAAAAAMTPPDPSTIGGDLEQDAKALTTKLANVAIRTTGDLEQAVLDRQDLGARAKAIEEFFAPFINQAHKLHRALCDRKNDVLGPILQLDVKLKRGITDYKTEQDRARRVEEQRQAEIRRLDEQTRLTNEAAMLEQDGEHELAAAVVEQAISAPAPVVVLPDVTKQIDGLKFRREYKWRYINDNPARAMELIPRSFLSIDEKKLGAYAGSMKGTGQVPGIQFYHEDVPVR